MKSFISNPVYTLQKKTNLSQSTFFTVSRLTHKLVAENYSYWTIIHNLLIWLTSLFAIEAKRSLVPNSVRARWSHVTGICMTSAPGVCIQEIQEKAQASESICQSRKSPLRSVNFVHDIRHLKNTMGSNAIQFMTKQIQVRSLKELNMEKNKNYKNVYW